MSITLLLWLIGFATLLILAFLRPAWGVALYMLTFFAMPPLWWWGDPIAELRWSLYGGCALLASVVFSKFFRSPQETGGNGPSGRVLAMIVAAILVNATFVHCALAENMQVSAGAYFLLAKFVLLFFLITAAVRTRTDFQIVLFSILLGAGYIGYEVTVNDRGRIRSGRLEGVGAPGAEGANELASLMVSILPLTGAVFVAGRTWEKAAMLVVAPFVLNVVLLCSSRGALLATSISAVLVLVLAPSHIRRKIWFLLMLGGVATWLLLGDVRIVERFLTTFQSSEERDTSASSRLVYWGAGLRVIADYPLGSGGSGFKTVHGPKYLKSLDIHYERRAVHNGYINEACEWGIQGLLLRLALMGGALVCMWKTMICCDRRFDSFGAAVGCTLIAGTVAFLITCLFGDRLDAEWGYWLAAITVCYARVFGDVFPADSNAPVAQAVAGS